MRNIPRHPAPREKAGSGYLFARRTMAKTSRATSKAIRPMPMIQPKIHIGHAIIPPIIPPPQVSNAMSVKITAPAITTSTVSAVRDITYSPSFQIMTQKRKRSARSSLLLLSLAMHLFHHVHHVHALGHVILHLRERLPRLVIGGPQSCRVVRLARLFQRFRRLVDGLCRFLTVVLRQNLVTIDIVDFLQPSATLYWYEGITILAVLLFQSLTQRSMQFGS
jgi:hypothetical protein